MAISRVQAQKDGVMGGCPLIDGREKLDFGNMIGEVITVEEFALVQTKKEPAYAITFTEYPKHYAWCGGALKKLIEAYGNDVIGTKLVVGEMVRTQNNNDYRTFEIAE